jgi:hypothetical protein
MIAAVCLVALVFSVPASADKKKAKITHKVGRHDQPPWCSGGACARAWGASRRADPGPGWVHRGGMQAPLRAGCADAAAPPHHRPS